MSEALSFVVTEDGADATQAAAAEREAASHPEFENAVIKLQAALEERCEQARQDPTLAPAERQDAIRSYWHAATDTYRKLRQTYEGQLEADVEQREKDLFKVDWSSHADVRNAYEVVYAATSGPGEEARAELERYSERAKRTGDKHLETAVFHISVERGISELRDSYLAASPERQKAWEKYKRARIKQDSFEKLRLTIATGTRASLVQPAELRS